jgi:putative nucleotidyltransferase with HDIG domain
MLERGLREGRASDTPRLRCADLLAALSLVTDLGMGNPPETAMRGCLLATSFARQLSLDDSTIADVYYTALLRYVGCTAPAHDQAFLAGGDDLQMRAHRARIDPGSRRDMVTFLLAQSASQPLPRRPAAIAKLITHRYMEREIRTADCEVASSMARRLGLSSGVQRSLHEIFERWDGRGVPGGLRGDNIALPVRIAQVTTVWVLLANAYGHEAAFKLVVQRAGRQLDPALTDAFLRCGRQLVTELSEGDVWRTVLECEAPPHQVVDEHDLDSMASAFGDLVDLKTPFTPGHSAGVAHLAGAAAQQLRLSDPAAVKRAGLLHDIGRAGVPNGIWERPGPLTGADWEQVRLHAYHTERILSRSPALAPLALIAGMHHERQDGSGYHRQASSAAVPMAARVLAAADTYQALTRDRPYRPARSADEAAGVLAADARARRLDHEAVEAVLAAAGQRTPTARRTWPCDLTDREVEVLRLVARGLSTREVAQELVISPKTADHHIQHVYTKVGVSTRAAATLFALEHDLLRA